MAESDTQSALAEGMGSGIGLVIAAVIERFFEVSFLVEMVIAGWQTVQSQQRRNRNARRIDSVGFRLKQNGASQFGQATR